MALCMEQATQVQGDSSGIGAVSNGGGNSEGTPSLGQSRERARSTTPLPSSQAQQPLAHQALQVAEATMLTTVRRQMGDAGVAKIGQTMISQQDTLRQQVSRHPSNSTHSEVERCFGCDGGSCEQIAVGYLLSIVVW